MRPVRYNVAASLDGFIADADGGFGWIPQDPSVDFAAIFSRVDTVLIGRRSYELLRQMGGSGPWAAGARVYVFSRSLSDDNLSGATLVRDDASQTVATLRKEAGDGEIWLFGGGSLFGSLLAAGQVDRVEVTIVPILLGGGVPLLPPGTPRTTLTLLDMHRYPSGMVTLTFAVPNSAT